MKIKVIQWVNRLKRSTLDTALGDVDLGGCLRIRSPIEEDRHVRCTRTCFEQETGSSLLGKYPGGCGSMEHVFLTPYSATQYLRFGDNSHYYLFEFNKPLFNTLVLTS